MSASASPLPTVPTVRREAFRHPEVIPTGTPTYLQQPPPPGVGVAPLTITMGTKCAQPGEVQTVTIQTTPGYDIAWAVLWADNSPHSEWHTYGLGKAPTGTFVASFIIPPTAPNGRTRTDVATSGATDHKSYTARGFSFWEVETTC